MFWTHGERFARQQQSSATHTRFLEPLLTDIQTSWYQTAHACYCTHRRTQRQNSGCWRGCFCPEGLSVNLSVCSSPGTTLTPWLKTPSLTLPSWHAYCGLCLPFVRALGYPGVTCKPRVISPSTNLCCAYKGLC